MFAYIMYNLRTNRTVSVVLSVATTVFAVAFLAYATSIGTNLSVDGTATVTGNSTLSGTLTLSGAGTFNGSNTFGDAGTDVNLFTGTLQASTTALFTTGIVTYAGSTFGSASTDVNLFTGTLQASSTALFTNGLTAYNNVVTTSAGKIGAATTTPSQALGVTGNVFVGSAATSTVFLTTTSSSIGGCIEMRSVKGTQYRMYVGPNDSIGATSTRFGNTAFFALWEPGSCQ